MQVKLCPAPDGVGETFVLCRSPLRREKERAIRERQIKGLTQGLEKLKASAEPGQAEVKEHPGDAYPLDFCLVSGLKLAEVDKPAVVIHEGRKIRFCCARYPKKFEQDPAAYFKKIDAAIIKQQLPHYPFQTCIVMKNEPLGGDMEKPFNLVHKNRLVRFCCEGCVEEFQKKPDPYTELDQAVTDKQKESYPIGTCVVSGQGLDSMGSAVEFVHANRMVRLSRDGCAHVFRKDPVKYMAKISVQDEGSEE